MAYTNIDDPSAYFQTALWTGSGSAGNAVTFDGNSDMQPDFVWSKRRDVGLHHVWKDTSRGGTSNNDQHLVSSLTNAEGTYATYRMDFDSDGFTLDASGDTGFQGSGTSMVSWAWKANGGTTVSNTDGNLTSTVQANQDAGFSIVQWTGVGGVRTVGHGLGQAPAMVMCKNRTIPTQWLIWHQGLTGPGYQLLFTTGAMGGPGGNLVQETPTSTVFKIGSSAEVSNNCVAYCFAEKQGYSKFGSYIANANVNGPFVYTGFKPAFLMIKNTNRVEPWMMYDNKRTPINQIDTVLQANSAGADTTAATDYGTDFLSNGFKIRAVGTGYANHTVGNKYIYMAFAENPFTTSTGIPTTAR